LILGTVDGIVAPEIVGDLLDQKACRKYFKETPIEPSQDRWDMFLNKVDQDGLDRILRSLELLREEVNFALSVIDIPSEEDFAVLKRLSGAIHRAQASTLGYDEIEPIAGFLWSLLSGFSFVTGYDEEDPITRTVAQI
jgi:hypothetical protein